MLRTVCVGIAVGVAAMSGAAEWQALNPLPTQADLEGIVVTVGGRQVAVGERGTLLERSGDGPWSLVDSGVEADLNAVAAFGEQAVVVGDGGVVLLSDTAGEWDLLPPPTDADLLGLASGPAGFVAVGTAGTVAVSPGGAGWTVTAQAAHDLRDVVWFDDRWVAVGDAGTVISSLDGGTWQTLTIDGEPDLVRLTAGAGLLVALDADRTAWASSDGSTWTSRRLFYGHQSWAIAHCGGRFVIAGRGLGVATSRSGVYWEQEHPPSHDFDFRDLVCYDDNLFGVAAGGHIAESDSALRWRDLTGFGGSHVVTVDAGSTRAVAGGGDTYRATVGMLLTSPDGVAWTEIVASRFGLWSSVAAGDDGFVAARDHDDPFDSWPDFELYFSVDGVDWQNTHYELGGARSVTWDGHRWLALGSWSFGISPDGVLWSFSPLDGTAESAAAVASDGERIVVVGFNGTAAWSYDGVAWNDADAPTDSHLRSVAWRHGRFVAVGDGGTVLSSPDGIQWQLRSSGVEVPLHAIRTTSTGFAAVGDDGLLLTSPGGIDWTAEIVPPGHTLYDVVERDGGLLVVGRDGLITRVAEADPASPPEAAFGWRPAQPRPGETVLFTSRSVGETTGLQWSFGDGATGDGVVVDHVYATGGDYTVELVAVGVAGSSSASATVAVAEPCTAPTAPVLAPPEVDPESGAVTLSWSHPGTSVYRVEASTSPTFDESDPHRQRVWTHNTSLILDLEWTDSRVFSLRVLATNECGPADDVDSPWSNVHVVDLEPRARATDAFHLLVPAAAHTPGLRDTMWTTELVLYNGGERPATVAVELQGAKVGRLSRALRAGETAVVADVVGELTPANAVGALLLGTDHPVLATSRTATENGDGSFGQLIPALQPAALSGDRNRLLGLVHSEAFRTNLGFASASTVPIEVHSEFRTADGLGILGERSDPLPPLGHVQRTDVLGDFATGGTEVSGVQGVVSVEPPMAALAAYASIVDNGTGDPTLRLATGPPDGWRLALGASLPTDRFWRDLAPCGSGAVAVAGRLNAASDDLRHWRLQELERNEYFRAVAGDGLRVVAVGGAAVSISDDCGDTWTTSDIPGVGGMRDVASSGSHWAAVAGFGNVLTSENGLTWELHEAAVPDSVKRIVRDRSGFAAVGGEVFARSADGAVWESVSLGPEISLVDVASGPAGYVVSGHGLWFSADGSSWTQVSDVGGRLTWTGDVFVAASNTGFRESYDGEVWTPIVTTAFPDFPVRVESIGDGVVATLGDGGRLGWLVGSDEMVVPAVAHLPGVNDAVWRSELILTDTGTAGSICRIELLERDVANTDPMSAMRELTPGETLVIANALDELFGFNGAGALRIACSPAAVAATSRTFTIAANGTYGQRVPALSLLEVIRSFEIGILAGLTESRDPESGTRSNLGLVSLCESSMTVEVGFRGADGTSLGLREYDLLPFEVVQRDRVLTELGVDDDRRVTLTIVSTTPGCAFAAWASVVDNGTHDPVFLTAAPAAGAAVGPPPGSTVFDNTEAMLVDRFPGSLGDSRLPAGSYTINVEGAGALGSAERPLQVLCLWRETGGGMRAEVLAPGDTVAGIQGSAPFWCVVPDLGSCSDNHGAMTVELRDSSSTRVLMLDAAANCVTVDELPGSRHLETDDPRDWRCTSSGDLGRPGLEPQVLVVFTDFSQGFTQRARVLRHGSELPTLTSDRPAVAVVVDWISAEDNTGHTHLEPR